MSYNLFVDDQRNPIECRNYAGDGSIYETEDFVIVRTYNQFYQTIKEKGLPKFISFDYDLGIVSFGNGLDCAEFLKFYCEDGNFDIPKYRVHSSWTGIFMNFDKILKTNKNEQFKE